MRAWLVDAEALAWQYASLLKGDYEVDVLTTTAVDAAYWANALPEGRGASGRSNDPSFPR